MCVCAHLQRAQDVSGSARERTNAYAPPSFLNPEPPAVGRWRHGALRPGKLAHSQLLQPCDGFPQLLLAVGNCDAPPPHLTHSMHTHTHTQTQTQAQAQRTHTQTQNPSFHTHTLSLPLTHARTHARTLSRKHPRVRARRRIHTIQARSVRLPHPEHDTPSCMHTFRAHRQPRASAHPTVASRKKTTHVPHANAGHHSSSPSGKRAHAPTSSSDLQRAHRQGERVMRPRRTCGPSSAIRASCAGEAVWNWQKGPMLTCIDWRLSARAGSAHPPSPST